jgi:hypothetical protein
VIDKEHGFGARQGRVALSEGSGMNNQLWGAVVIIVLGYVLGFYFQSRSIAHIDKRIDDLWTQLNGRIDDLNSSVNHRFDDLKDWIRSGVKRLEDRIERDVATGG